MVEKIGNTLHSNTRGVFASVGDTLILDTERKPAITNVGVLAELEDDVAHFSIKNGYSMSIFLTGIKDFSIVEKKGR